MYRAFLDFAQDAANSAYNEVHWTVWVGEDAPSNKRTAADVVVEFHLAER